MRVLWLTPNKPANISVGRERLTAHLEADGFDITLRAGRPGVVPAALQGDYDAIIGTTRAGAIIGAGLSAVTGWPLVVDHIDPIRQFAATSPWPLAALVRQLEHLAFRQSVHTLYVYAEEASRVRRHAPAATKTALGVEYDQFAEPAPEVVERARDRLDAAAVRENVAIYIGGLEPIYHIEELLASMEHLPDWSLVVIGAGSLSDRVSDAADASPAISYLGTVPHADVPGYLQAADVGVSLVDDPHTLKLLEYGAARLPAVQLAGRATDRYDGLVEFCDADPPSIGAAIDRASGADRARLDAMQAHAKEHSWRRIAGDYAAVLRTLG